MTPSGWIHSKPLDLLLVLLPPFIGMGVVALWPQVVQPDLIWSWIILDVLFDGTHGVVTASRVYQDEKLKSHFGWKLFFLPVLLWMILVALGSGTPQGMFNFLAYFAAYHFVQQQYGIMMLYCGRSRSRLDRAVIYATTLGPILHWMNGVEKPSWGQGWLWSWNSVAIQVGALVVMGVIVVLYLIQEVTTYFETRAWNGKKNLFLLGSTCFCVYGLLLKPATYPGEFFTIMVISHSLAYVAIVWSYHQRTDALFPRFARDWRLYLVSAIAVAAFFVTLQGILIDHRWLKGLILPSAVAVPLISFALLPQFFHFFADSWVWRRKFTAANHVNHVPAEISAER